MNRDISNIEYFEETKTNPDDEKFKYYFKIYLNIAIVCSIIFFIIKLFSKSNEDNIFGTILIAIFKGFFFPVAIVAIIWAFFAGLKGTSVAGVTVSNSSRIGLSDVMKSSNKEHMSNINDNNNSVNINTSTTTISQKPIISKPPIINRTDISQKPAVNTIASIPQKTTITKSVSNIITPTTKQNIVEFKNDAKALLSKTLKAVPKLNINENTSNKLQVKSTSNSQQPIRNPNMRPNNNSPQSIRNPNMRLNNNSQQSIRNPNMRPNNNKSQPIRNPNIIPNNNSQQSMKTLPNKTAIATPVSNIPNNNVVASVNNMTAGSNSDNVLTDIIMVGGICILSYILYMLYNEIVMLNKLKKDKDEMDKRRNKLILTSNIIV
jgi:hypothetical protein